MGIPMTGIEAAEPMKAATMLPVGWHTVTIDEATEGTSSGGHPQVEFVFEAGGLTIRDWLVFAPPRDPMKPAFALRKAKALIQAAGIEVTDGDSFPTEKLIGKKLSIYVGEEPDNREPGKMRRRVQGFEAPGKGSGDQGTVGGAVADDDDLPF